METESKEKQKCSGRHCPMNYTLDISECQCTDTCPYFTPAPTFNMTAFENIVDIAMKMFGISTDGRKDLTTLFMAYTAEYIRQTCFPIIDNDAYKTWVSKHGLVQDCCCEPEKKDG